MKLNRLALVSAAVLLLMSGTANAGLAKWLLESPKVILESPKVILESPKVIGAIAKVVERRLGISESRELATGSGTLRPVEGSALQAVNHANAGLTKVSSLYNDASSQILDDLQNYPNARAALTQQQLENIINVAVTKTIESAAKKTNSGLTFEVLTGKLTVERSYTGSLGTVTVGEINVYKVSAAVAGSILACKELDQPEFDACVKTALAKMKGIATKEWDVESLSVLHAHPRARAADSDFGPM